MSYETDWPSSRQPWTPPIPERVTRVEMLLTGIDGRNGLRSTIAKHEDRLSALEKWREAIDVTKAMATIWMRWAGIAAVVLFATFASDAAVERVLSILKTTKSLLAGGQ